MADPSDRAVRYVVLRPLASWQCRFEFRLGHGYVSVVSVVCFLADVWLITRPEETYRVLCVWV